MFHIWDVILPIGEVIFFKMVKSTNQKSFHILVILLEDIGGTIILTQKSDLGFSRLRVRVRSEHPAARIYHVFLIGFKYPKT